MPLPRTARGTTDCGMQPSGIPMLDAAVPENGGSPIADESPSAHAVSMPSAPSGTLRLNQQICPVCRGTLRIPRFAPSLVLPSAPVAGSLLDQLHNTRQQCVKRGGNADETCRIPKKPVIA